MLFMLALEKIKTLRINSKALSPSYVTVVLLLLASCAVYSNALFNGFVYDDSEQILGNRWITDVRYLKEIFTKHSWGFLYERPTNYYRPLINILFMIIYHIFGFAPWGYHAVNILLHAGVTLLFFSAAKRIMPSSSDAQAGTAGIISLPTMAALLFAVHPVHTEAVSWISGLPDLSFTFFFFLSLYFHIRSTEGLKGGTLFSALSFFLATLCKESSLVLPVILIAYDYSFRGQEFRFLHLKRYSLHLLAAGVYLFLRIYVLGSFAPLRHHSELAEYEYAMLIFPLFKEYLTTLLLPINLNIWREFHLSASIFQPDWIFSSAVAVGYVALVFIASRKHKVIFFSLMLIAVPLMPAFNIRAIIGVPMSERYLYLSSAGFILLLVLSFSWCRARIPSAFSGIVVISIALMVCYSMGTISRNRVWKDDYALFSDAVKKSPNTAEPHLQLGCTLAGMGKVDEAIDEFKLGINLDPRNPILRNALGEAFFRKGWLDSAINQYSSAIRLNPDAGRVHYNLGIAFFEKGLTEKAIDEYQIALRLNPIDSRARHNLAFAFIKAGEIDRAIHEYQVGLTFTPYNAEFHYNLAALFLRKGLIDRAVEQYTITIDINPNKDEAHYNLGRIFFGKGMTDSAIGELNKARLLNPNIPEIHYMLGLAYKKKGLVGQAFNEFSTSVRLNPANQDYRKELAAIEGQLK